MSSLPGLSNLGLRSEDGALGPVDLAIDGLNLRDVSLAADSPVDVSAVTNALGFGSNGNGLGVRSADDSPLDLQNLDIAGLVSTNNKRGGGSHAVVPVESPASGNDQSGTDTGNGQTQNLDLKTSGVGNVGMVDDNNRPIECFKSDCTFAVIIPEEVEPF